MRQLYYVREMREEVHDEREAEGSHLSAVLLCPKLPDRTNPLCMFDCHEIFIGSICGYCRGTQQWIVSVLDK